MRDITKTKIAYKSIPIIILTVLLVCFSIFNTSLVMSKIVSAAVVVVSFYNTIKVRKNWLLLIIFSFIFYCNYSICIADYLWPIENDYLTSLRFDDSAIVSINILLVFNLALTLFVELSGNNKKIEKSLYFDSPSNSVIVFGAILVLVFIFIFGFSRPNIAGQRGNPSAYFEYSLIIFIVAFYYAGTKFENLVLVFLAIMYILTNVIYGVRITALQLVFCLFLIFLSYKVSLYKILPYVLVMILVFYSIGIFRANFDFSIEGFKKTIDVMLNRKFVSDTAYSSFFTSQTFVKVADDMSFFERLPVSMKSILLNIFGGSLIEGGNLAEYTRTYYMHYYGGILPFFGWFYAKWIGVLAFAIYVIFLLNIIVNNYEKSGFRACAAIYIVSSVPRWYLYSPLQLIRGLLLFILVYAICNMFDRTYKKKELKV